jgi:hypothetical protein
MPRRKRGSEQIGTAGFSPIDTSTDTFLENLDPDTTTGRVQAQDEDLERGTSRAKRRARKGGPSTERK